MLYDLVSQTWTCKSSSLSTELNISFDLINIHLFWCWTEPLLLVATWHTWNTWEYFLNQANLGGLLKHKFWIVFFHLHFSFNFVYWQQVEVETLSTNRIWFMHLHHSLVYQALLSIVSRTVWPFLYLILFQSLREPFPHTRVQFQTFSSVNTCP